MPEKTTTHQAETIIGITKGETTTAITINIKINTKIITSSIITKGFPTSIRTSKTNTPETPKIGKLGDMNLIINTISSNINNMRKDRPEII